MDENIQLKLIGITYNQIESGVYALVLEEPVSGTRLAIVIGYPEAQSIECRLQNVRTPRPLSHDLLASVIKALDATLERIDIHRIPGGPYAARLTLVNFYGERCEIDARSSDAIALAIRMNAPIYTTRALLDKEGYTPQNNNRKGAQKVGVKPKPVSVNPYEGQTLTQLHQLLDKYVQEENYEEAAKIKAEIEKKQGGNVD